MIFNGTTALHHRIHSRKQPVSKHTQIGYPHTVYRCTVYNLRLYTLHQYTVKRRAPVAGIAWYTACFDLQESAVVVPSSSEFMHAYVNLIKLGGLTCT